MNILAALLCVMAFSLTAPFTRLAAMETSAETITLIRVLGASFICLIFALNDKWLPPKAMWKGILFTALGSVIGFATLMGLAMKEVPSGHAAVALAALPLATAIDSIIRDKKNPGPKFWFFALSGTILCFGFFFSLNIEHLMRGDLLILLSVVFAAFGYVEGGRTSRTYGGRRTMSWAILATLPLTIPLAVIHFSDPANAISSLSSQTLFSMSYLALISQSLGMFLWFKVLAKGPIEKIVLIQLAQPFFTLFAAIFMLGEVVLDRTWLIAILVAVCIIGSNKAKEEAIVQT